MENTALDQGTRRLSIGHIRGDVSLERELEEPYLRLLKIILGGPLLNLTPLKMASGQDSSLGDPTLLAKMDKLREIGISDYIQLPQVRLPGFK